MAESWQRKRHPDEVPTPLAVAVSDFCRRAKAQPSAAEVREALAIVDAADEFRVRALTDAEPEARPLGPFAVVDILHGADAALAARRQESGYYELARALAAERAQTTTVSVQTPDSARAEAAQSSAAAPAKGQEAKLTARLTELLGTPAPSKTGKGKAEPEPKQTIAERIAPKRRGTLPTNAASEDTDLERAETKPIPRGRFSRLEAPKQPLSTLFPAAAREEVETLLEQHPTRIALLRSLATQYSGRKALLDLQDLEVLLERHGLIDQAVAKEREVVLAALTEHRGAMGRAAWALDLSNDELRNLVDTAGLTQEVEELRERFRREALSPKNLKLRLDLLARTKYLDDLGIRRKFSERLQGDLRNLVRDSLPEATSLTQLIELTAKRHAVDATSLRRALDRLELSEILTQQLSKQRSR